MKTFLYLFVCKEAIVNADGSDVRICIMASVDGTPKAELVRQSFVMYDTGVDRPFRTVQEGVRSAGALVIYRHHM